jgi:Streptomyces sporulation and cell division protein, SsgA
MSSNCSEISAELSLGLVGPEHAIVPLMAELSYSCADPYAVQMAFEVGTDEPVKWILARDLLAAALHGSAGLGDVRAWPSAASCDPDAATAGRSAAEQQILNIAMSSPYGQAQFEVSAKAIEEFLQRTYQLVATGQESSYLNFDAELTELLSQA